MYGESSFRRTSLETGEVLDQMRFPDSIFAEGFTFLSDSVVCLLTWREGVAFTLNPWTMEILSELPLQGEGWGLCLADSILYQSNGSATLLIRSPETFQLLDSIEVTIDGIPQYFLNELEYARGFILANQWRTHRILFINSETGAVERVMDLGSTAPGTGGVLNGTASAGQGYLYCTGKNWPVTLIISGI